MSGKIACAALPNTTSHASGPNAMIASTGMPSWPNAASLEHQPAIAPVQRSRRMPVRVRV
jgi:hypothetical protein